MKFRNIGDVLLTAPLFENLRRCYPDAQIDAAVNAGTETMLTHNPNVDVIHVYDRERIKKLSLWKRLKAEVAFVRKIRAQKYDMVINTTGGDRGAQIALVSGAGVKVGYPVKKNRLLKNVFTRTLPEQEFRHTVETNLDVLRVLGLPVETKRVSIFWSEADEVEGLPKRFVHIHPVSRWLFKCVADKTMAMMIDYVENTLKTKVVLTAAPVEEEMQKIEAILSHCSSKPVNMAGKLTLKQTAALNKKAAFFIGVDTAIMHISAANDVPVLAFFGPSGADHWGPWDNDEKGSGYRQRKGFQTMGRHRVIQESWECVPCGKDGCEGTKISDCLMRLDMAFIQQNIDAIDQTTKVAK